MEASSREAPWPCAVQNAAPAQNRPAKIIRAAARVLALLIDDNADIDGLLVFGFYLRRHAWRKNVSSIVQGDCLFADMALLHSVRLQRLVDGWSL
jgi:hypothetical protein